MAPSMLVDIKVDFALFKSYFYTHWFKNVKFYCLQMVYISSIKIIKQNKTIELA